MILNDCELICQLERKYLEKQTNYKLNKIEYEKLRVFRYASYINDIHNSLVTQYSMMDKAVGDEPDYSIICQYNPLSRTNALRYLLEKYQNKR